VYMLYVYDKNNNVDGFPLAFFAVHTC